MTEKKRLSTKVVADALGISSQAVLGLIKRGVLVATQDDKGRYDIDRDSFKAYQGKVSVPAEMPASSGDLVEVGHDLVEAIVGTGKEIVEAVYDVGSKVMMVYEVVSRPWTDDPTQQPAVLVGPAMREDPDPVNTELAPGQDLGPGPGPTVNADPQLRRWNAEEDALNRVQVMMDQGQWGRGAEALEPIEVGGIQRYQEVPWTSPSARFWSIPGLVKMTCQPDELVTKGFTEGVLARLQAALQDYAIWVNNEVLANATLQQASNEMDFAAMTEIIARAKMIRL